MLKRLWLFIFSLLLTIVPSACHKTSNEAVHDQGAVGADSMAIICYKMQANGQFDEYVNAMLSCDGTTPDYKQRMVVMLHQHQKQINEEKKGVKDVSLLRTEMHNNNKMANVFLSVSYKDGSNEEVMLPMVYDGKQWRMQ